MILKYLSQNAHEDENVAAWLNAKKGKDGEKIFSAGEEYQYYNLVIQKYIYLNYLKVNSSLSIYRFTSLI